jgi:hypothetical protein
VSGALIQRKAEYAFDRKASCLYVTLADFPAIKFDCLGFVALIQPAMHALVALSQQGVEIEPNPNSQTKQSGSLRPRFKVFRDRQ